MTKNIVLSRPLSLSEHFVRSRTANRFYSNFQVTGTYSEDLASHLDWVYMALRKTLLDYPLLICNIQKENNDSIFRPIKQASLGDILQLESKSGYIENNTINEKFMKYVNTINFQLYSEEPLFRLILLGEHLSAAFEHTITDGLVGPYFHEIYLKNLAYVSNKENLLEYESLYGETPDKVDLNTQLFNYDEDKDLFTHSLPPPCDLFMEDPSFDYSNGDPLYHDKVLPEGYETRWPGRFPPTKDQTIACKLVHFSPTETKQILAKCKSHGVTITPFIQVVQIFTLQPILGDKHYTTHRMAITTRRHVKPELVPDYFQDAYAEKDYKLLGGYAHFGLRENYPPLFEFSWDKVQEIHKNLIRDSQNRGIFNIYKDFRDVYDKTGDNLEVFEKQMATKADTSKISNLGYVNFPVYDSKWTVNNLVFSQDMSPPSSDFVFNIISTPLGGLNIVFGYHDHTFDDSEYPNFDSFVENFRENLLNL
ncbi:alcohol acetyltransferase [Scheffersomyces coipomensis]|uniref:alcohol acetyltransferase n=1 Tax=Scheffersomyces coipomensis TaxID=1788519 RepID=UPI00315D0E50